MLEGTRSDASIGGEIIGQRGAPSVTVAGRICSEASCSTRLSIYNLEAFCAVHNAARPPRKRRRRVKAEPSAVPA